MQLQKTVVNLIHICYDFIKSGIHNSVFITYLDSHFLKETISIYSVLGLGIIVLGIFIQLKDKEKEVHQGPVYP